MLVSNFKILSPETKKAQAQKCKREKLPVNLPDGSDYRSMDSSVLKTEPSKNSVIDEEALSCATENEFLSPVQLLQASSCSSVLLSDTKCVCICENAPVSISDFSR